MSEQDSSSRSWPWNSANKAPNSRHSSEKLKVKSPLNTLASALGFRPKKSPTLTTEDPLLPIQAPPPSEYPIAGRVVGTRPPSKSISSTVSRAESSEPKTPSDSNHNAARHSLLTLSDTDPFAPRGIVTIASPSDPTRLSAYSNHSVPDVPQPKTDDRMSYASSSSLSHSHGSHAESSPSKKARSPISPQDSFPSRRLFKKSSETNLARSHSYTPSDTLARTAQVPPTLHKSPSSATLISPTRTATRPSMRPRGLTENGMVHKAGFFVQPNPKPAPHPPPAMQPTPPSSSKPLSPRVIVRQASAQRLNSPPAAPPPRHGLPAPPSKSPRPDAEPGPYRLAPSHSTTSSTISFTSSVSSVENLQPLSPVTTPERPRRTSNRSFFSSATEVCKNGTAERSAPVLASPPMSLKKALSHQSLRRRVSPSTGGTATPESEKTPSKRGFPHPRIPLPPLPSLSLRSISANASSPADQSTSSQDKRVSSASSTGGRRRRLFSGSSSRRPSTSNSARGDDDAQSIFSVQSDQDMYINSSPFRPWVSTQASPSHWEDAKPDTAPNSPVRTFSSFATQQTQTSPSGLTLSPFRKGEVSLPRARGMSIRSSDTVFSDHDPELPIRGAEPTRQFQRSNTLSSRNKGELTRRTTEVSRPSTAQPAYQAQPAEPLYHGPPEAAVPDPIEQTFTPSSSPPPVVIRSLPPPPRRARPAPPPEPDSVPSPAPVKAVALPPRPPRRRANTTKSIEKGIHRRSIMRKPSFLDIDDESEDEDVSIPPGSDIGDSFIDFARESFDTVRSHG
ncbi:hypothetical protein BKA70DRAFT_1251006 [Coprinopsis sp. MPI-PUGE-AT-0042]|nr:hypothetical protein BKA70DRAFT_1251006 [Coprinopsis sp. MPI-PUGE-AT-0042]